MRKYISLPPTLISITLVTILFHSFIKAYNFDINTYLPFTLSIVLVLLFQLLKIKKVRLYFIIGIALAFISIVIYFYLFLDFTIVKNEFIDVYNKIINYEYIKHSYQIIIITSVSILLNIFIYLIVFKVNTVKMILFSILSILYFLFLIEFTKFYVSKIFFIYSFTMIFLLLHNIKVNNIKKYKVKHSKYYTWATIFSIYIVLSSSILSSVFQVDMSFLDDIDWNDQEYQYEKEQGNTDPEDDFKFSTNENISSDSLNDSTLVLLINSPGMKYLRANTYYDYSNGNWFNRDQYENSEEIQSNLAGNIILTTGNELLRNNIPNEYIDAELPLDEIINKFYDKESLNVYYYNIDTDVIFTSDITSKIDYPAFGKVYKDLDDIIFTSNYNKKGFEYTYETYSLKFYEPEVLDALRNSSNQLFEYISNYSIPKGTYSQFEDLESDLSITNYVVDERYYTVKPYNFYPEIRQLTLDITRDEDNVYDKLTAIEKYLSQNYTYDLEVNYIDDDFLHEFLFVDKKGYCTHYATAFTMMARSIGIPTRYVKGFVVTNENSRELFDPLNVYEIDDPLYEEAIYVTRKQFHSYPEAYIPGFGWIMFEPTSAYTEMRNEELSSKDQDDIDNPDTDKPNNNGNDNDNISDKGINVLNIFKYIALLLLISLIGFVIYILRKVNTKEYSNNESMLISFNNLLDDIQYLNRPIKDNETIYEYIKEVSKNNRDEVYSKLNEIINIYHIARYSNVQIDNKQLNKVIEYIDEFNEYLNDELSKIEYLFMKIMKAIKEIKSNMHNIRQYVITIIKKN